MSYSIFEGEKTFGDITLRPFSLGTEAACRKLGLSFIFGEQVADDEATRQLIAFAWLQSAPLPDVITAVSDGSFWAKVDAFAFTLSPSIISKIVSEITRIATEAREASVEVQKKPGLKGDDSPKN